MFLEFHKKNYFLKFLTGLVISLCEQAIRYLPVNMPHNCLNIDTIPYLKNLRIKLKAGLFYKLKKKISIEYRNKS